MFKPRHGVCLQKPHLCTLKEYNSFHGYPQDLLGKHTILLWQRSETESAPLVTRMLMANGFDKRGYRNFTELVSVINAFLLE